MSVVSRREFCRRAVIAGTATFVLPRLVHAAPEWVDVRQVGPFICQAAFPLASHQSLLGELVPLERELRRVLAVRPCRTSVYLHLLANERQHHDYIAERFPDVPYRRALFIKQDGRASVFAYLNSELAVDVRHECTHAILHADLPMVPLWLDEGLAEYFEVAKPFRARQHPHLRRVKRDLNWDRTPSMYALEAKQKLEDLTARDYRAAWAWVHYMLHGPVAAHAELVTFLHDIRSNAAPGSLAARLDRAVGGSQLKLSQHFSRL